MVTSTRGGGTGAERLPTAISTNCEISHCTARFKLEGPQRIILDATNPDPSDKWKVACYRDTLIIYAVRILL